MAAGRQFRRVAPLALLSLLPGQPLAVSAAAPDPRTPATAGTTEPRAAGPLEEFVETLDAAALDDAPDLQRALRAAESQLARAAPPRTGCAEALGAERYAGLHAAVGRARHALGDRSGARVAWQAAVDCAPRLSRYRLGLATALLTLGELDAADAALARASQLAPDGLDVQQIQARVDFAAARWPQAATRAAQVAARLQRAHEASLVAEGAARAPRALPDAAAPGTGSEAVAFWRILEQLARRRAGQPADDAHAPDPGLGGRWPEPLWLHLQGELDERALVEKIRANESPRRRREMSCEALYYTAQRAFAAGDAALGRRRLARVVNLKVPYFVEHELALAELARLRRAP